MAMRDNLAGALPNAPSVLEGTRQVTAYPAARLGANFISVVLVCSSSVGISYALEGGLTSFLITAGILCGGIFGIIFAVFLREWLLILVDLADLALQNQARVAKQQQAGLNEPVPRDW
jgi:hypothetical protein